jgi:phosphoglycolate phosphatase
MKPLHPHLKDKKHVIWDWNGTLLSDIDHAVNVVNRLLREEGLPQITIEQYKSIFSFPIIEYYKRLGFDCAPEKFHDLCERFNQHFHDELHTCTLWPGVRETLAHVKASGKVQSILSASEHNLLNNSVRQFGLTDLFDHIIGIADKKAGSKVDRGRELIRKVNLPLEHTIMIGDTDHDLEVGEALGIDIILVDHGHQETARLKAAHSKVLTVL